MNNFRLLELSVKIEEIGNIINQESYGGMI